MRGSCFWLVTGLLCAACSDKQPAARPPGGRLGGDECRGAEDGVVCASGAALVCLDGGVSEREDCADAGMTCDAMYGCVSCTPHRYLCEGDKLYLCEASGRERTFKETCKGDEQCSPRGCRNLCADAEQERSYLGCEYFPVFTSNSLLDPVFDPAVVIANPNLVAAEVSIDRAGKLVEKRTVPPASSETVMLEFDEQLRREAVSGSMFVKDGAYHLVSSVPITVHQFNPLSFRSDVECRDVSADGEPTDGRCYSFTNDASLLLPVHVLERDEGEGELQYFGVSRPAFMVQDGGESSSFASTPGFLALTAVGKGPVHVSLRSSAYVASDGEAGNIPALSPGDTLELTLARGDVVQLATLGPTDACPGKTGAVSSLRTVCDPGRDYDLTGTQIEADGPLQVIGGHDCTYVPFDRPACDHLEETLFPVDTWGKRAIVTRPRALLGVVYRLRVLSGDDDNEIGFDPAIRKPITLDRGEFMELETDQHVIVRGKKRFVVAQFLVGQGGTRDSGDPSMSFAIPTDQYRSSYYFLSPETYKVNYVNVIAQRGDTVILDGVAISEDLWEEVGSSDYRVATHPLDLAGPHEVTSANGIGLGVVVYGYGDYTSYMLPGGLDLRVIGKPAF